MRRELKTTSTGEVVNPDIISENIPNGAVTTNKLEDGAVTSDKLDTNAVETAKIKDGAVETAKIKDGAVTSAKLGASSVTNEKVNNGAIDYNKLAQALKNLIDGKQDALSETQLDAVNSGIDATKLTNLLNHLSNTSNPHSVTKSQVGLGNVDNTSDANKPVSTATQNALNLKIDKDSIYYVEVEHNENISQSDFNKLINADIPILINDNNLYFLQRINNYTTYKEYIFFNTKVASSTGTQNKITIRDDNLLVMKGVEMVAQYPLVSGTTIKTINGNSILGSGDLVVGGSIYQHNITISDSNNLMTHFSMSLITNSSTPLTKSTFINTYQDASLNMYGVVYGNINESEPVDMGTLFAVYGVTYSTGLIDIIGYKTDLTSNNDFIEIDLNDANLTFSDDVLTI